MMLPEAIKQARKDLGISQKKLAEMAGIQRRQLSTLESGGNVTLATVRKVIGQLPNLESFTLDAVEVNVLAKPRRVEDEFFAAAIYMIGFTLQGISETIRAGGAPSIADMEMLKKVSDSLVSSIEERVREGRFLIRPSLAENPEP